MLQPQTSLKYIASVTVFLLIALLLFFALGLVLLSGSVYRQIATDIAENSHLRTNVAYLNNQLQRHDALGSLQTGYLNGLPTLILRQNLADSYLALYIYSYDGMLRSKLVEYGLELPPGAGLTLSPLAGLKPQWTAEGLLRLDLLLADDLVWEVMRQPRSIRFEGDN